MVGYDWFMIGIFLTPVAAAFLVIDERKKRSRERQKLLPGARDNV